MSAAATGDAATSPAVRRRMAGAGLGANAVVDAAAAVTLAGGSTLEKYGNTTLAETICRRSAPVRPFRRDVMSRSTRRSRYFMPSLLCRSGDAWPRSCHAHA